MDLESLLIMYDRTLLFISLVFKLEKLSTSIYFYFNSINDINQSKIHNIFMDKRFTACNSNNYKFNFPFGKTFKYVI